MNLRVLVIGMSFFGVLLNQNSIQAQCPDALNQTSNSHCFQAEWDIPPVPIPLTVEFNNQIFNYVGGSGTSGDPADYTNSGGGTCNQSGDPFTGVIEIDGNVCNYSAGLISTAVPIELVEFNATVRQDRVILNWSTASEWNNKGFAIERTSTGSNWVQIGWVPGAGSSTQLISYNFVDVIPSAGLNYYRLVQYDSDGRKDISPIQSVNLEGDNIELMVNPVPASSTLFLSGFGDSMTIWDIKGSLVSTYNINEGSIDISQLEPGMYVLRDTNSGKVARFVKN